MAEILFKLEPLGQPVQVATVPPATPPAQPASPDVDFRDMLQLVRPKKGVPAKMPVAPQAAGGGKQFVADTAKLNPLQREEAVLKAALSGQIPAHLKTTVPVTTTWTGPDGKTHTGQFFVAPDYLAIGTDDDFVRMPMSPLTAQKIADKQQAVLPTKKMVDLIYQQADAKLVARPMSYKGPMQSNDYLARHNEDINGDLAGVAQSALKAGHKKDVVITNRLASKPEGVAIYGFHKANGTVWQPLQIPHENTYADYSHGIRLVSKTMLVDGQPMDIRQVMASKELYGLVSDEGPMTVTRIPGA